MSQGSTVADREGTVERQRREIAAAVHELRTPLATIHGFLETLARRGDQLDDETREHIIEVALRNAVLLGQRIDTLLEYERFAVGEVQVSLARRSLRRSVHRIVEDCAGLLLDHQVEVEVPAHIEVEVDETALAHVLGNLLGNAAKHSPAGTTVTVRAVDSHYAVCLQVIDEGHGIDPEDLPNVFEAFYRGRDRPRGAGLGLSVARHYVELWGGHLAIDSVVGEGTVVTFSLTPTETIVDVTDPTAAD